MKKLILILLAAMILSACSDGGSSSSGSAVGAGSLQVVMNSASTDADSLVLRGTLSGGTDSVHKSLTTSATSANFDDLTAGEWSFEAMLYDAGEVVQKGEGETTITDDSTAYLTIELFALYGYLAVTLSVESSTNIASGTMTLTNVDDASDVCEDTLTLGDSAGSFSCGPLTLGETYAVVTKLYDASGTLLYEFEDEVTITGANTELSWTLSSSVVSLVVSLELAESDTITATLSLPASSARAPTAGEVLISEVYTVRNSETQFIEIYNGSPDTISLNGCSIGGKTSSDMVYSTEFESAVLPPASYYSIGGDSAEGVSGNTLNVSLIPSGSTSNKAILLVCNGGVIDSVYFAYVTSVSDCDVSSAPLKNKVSTHLILSEWENRLKSSAWCYSSTSTPSEAAPDECSAFECEDSSSSEDSGDSDDSSESESE